MIGTTIQIFSGQINSNSNSGLIALPEELGAIDGLRINVNGPGLLLAHHTSTFTCISEFSATARER